MGRRRSIEREELLDAAEAVLRREGAARTTLGAVAAEAGVSKATVLYDCKCKGALIRALIERRLAADVQHMEAARAAQGGGGDAAIRALIGLVERGISDDERALFLPLVATLAQNDELAAPIRAHYRRLVSDIEATSASPDDALLAFLAIEGLRSIESFDIIRLDPPRRRRALEGIARLADRRPADAETKESVS